MTIFHTQIEQMSKPTITDSTIQWACQKRWNSERLEDVSGVTDEEMSAGFMSVPWSVPSGEADLPRGPGPRRISLTRAAPPKKVIEGGRFARRPRPELSRRPKPARHRP